MRGSGGEKTSRNKTPKKSSKNKVQLEIKFSRPQFFLNLLLKSPRPRKKKSPITLKKKQQLKKKIQKTQKTKKE